MLRTLPQFEVLARGQVDIAAAIGQVFEAARQEAMLGDRVLITGSFYLVGPALRQLGLYSRPQS